MDQGLLWDERFLKQADKILAAQYREALKNIREQIEWMYRKYGDNVSYSDMMQYNRLFSLEKEFAEQIKDLTGENVKLTRNTIKTVYKENYSLAGYAAESTLDARLGFGNLNADAINAAVLNPMDRITWIQRETATGKATLQKISEAVTQSLIQGEGYSKTSAKLKDILEISGGRTNRIVRTEAHRAQTEGRLLAFEKTEKAADTLGLTVKKQWMSVMDERTRDSHAKMNGKLADDEGLFHLPATEEHGAITCEGPGLTGYPGEDIHCRCTTVAYFEDVPGFEEMEFESYADWAERKKISTKKTVSEMHFISTSASGQRKATEGPLPKTSVSNINKMAVKEAEQYAIDNNFIKKYPGNPEKRIDYSVSTTETANKINKALEELNNRFTDGAFNEIASDTSKRRWWASYDSDVDRLNLTRTLNDPDKMYQTSMNHQKITQNKLKKMLDNPLKIIETEQGRIMTGYTETQINEAKESLKYERWAVVAKGKEVESIVTHEFGHKIFRRIDRYEWAVNYLKMKESGDIYKISAYAGFADVNECFAECMTMYIHEPQKLPKYIFNFMEAIK
jgi:uncharacterized protein with gpF-like domain